MCVGTLTAFWFVLQNNDLKIAQTTALVIVVMYQWLIVFSVRTYKSVFKTKPHGNRAIIWALGAQAILQFLGIYTIWGNLTLGTYPVGIIFWIFALFIGMSIIVVDEIYKLMVHEMKVI